MSDRCRSCGQPVAWAVTETRHRTPLDAAPVPYTPEVNLLAWRDPDGTLRVRPRQPGEQARDHERYARSHFATCPDAATHRKPRKR